jgi:Beta-propeller repeat
MQSLFSAVPRRNRLFKEPSFFGSAFAMTVPFISRAMRQRLMATMFALGCLFSVQMRGQVQTSSPLAQQPKTSNAVTRDALQKTLLHLPLHFEATPDGGMASRARAGSLRIDAGGKVSFAGGGKTSVSMQLDGANPEALPAGQDKLPGHSNYFLGNDPARWRAGISQFARVQVPSVYPGIDLVYYGNGDQLEHDYLIAQNADPSQIEMRFDGAAARLDRASGDLLLGRASSGPVEIRLKKPVAYQANADGTRTLVEVKYRSGSGGRIGFSVGKYDRQKPLIIDPIILYSTYFGGSLDDFVQDLKLDSAGDIYFLMGTKSATLPQQGNPASACAGTCLGNTPTSTNQFPSQDMYVAKMDAMGQQLDFATYLGGSGADTPSSLALDAGGNVYVHGGSSSTDFPVVNAYQSTLVASQYGPSSNDVLIKISADGSQLLYSTYIGYGLTQNYLGGSNNPNTLALAPNGIAYIVGSATAGGTATFTSVNPLFHEGLAYVAMIDTTKSGASSVPFASPIGDDANPTAEIAVISIATDSTADLWIYGKSASATFPAISTGAFQTSCGSPCNNAFLMEINPAGTAVTYGTYLGGMTTPTNSSGILPRDMSIDAAGNIYIVGTTTQTDYPLLHQAYGYSTVTADSSGDYGFVTKVAAGGEQILYSTLLQSGTSNGPFSLTSVTGTPAGLMAVSGSAGTGLVTANALPSPNLTNSTSDAFFVLFDTTQVGASSLLTASYLGSSNGYTIANSVQIDAGDNLVIGGSTSATDLPVQGAYQNTCADSCGYTDGFLARVQPSSAFTALPSNITFPSTAVGSSSATMEAVITNGTVNAITTSTPVLSDTHDFTATPNNCATIPAFGYCTVTFTFTPQTSGPLTGTYSIADLNNPSQPLTINLTGNAAGGASATLMPEPIDFGTLAVPGSMSEAATLTNTGTSPLTMISPTVTGSSFSLMTNHCGTTLAAGASCQYVIEATVSAGGAQTGSLTVVDNAGTQTVQLTVTGQAPVANTLTPGTLPFGNVFLNQTVSMPITYTNNSSSVVTIRNYAFNPYVNSPYGISAATCTVNIAPNTSCTYTVSFTPTTAGQYNATFVLDDGLTSPMISVTGTGVSTGTGGVVLIPNTLNFQNVPANNGAVQEITLANNTSTDITVIQFGIVFSDPTDFEDGFNYPNDCQLTPVSGSGGFTITVPANTSCNMDIEFNPAGNGGSSYSSNLTVSYTYAGQTAVNNLVALLTGNTITDAAPAVTPATIQFPATASGKTSPAQMVTVSNGGQQALGIQNVTINGANPANFTETNNCPASLSQNTSCQISVTFSPTGTAIEFTGNLDIAFGEGFDDSNITLTGGTSPQDFVLSTPAAEQGKSNPAWVINVAPLSAQFGFDKPITFTVSGLDASYGTPKFTPDSVTPGSKTVSTTLTLTQTSAAGLQQVLLGPKIGLPVLAFSLAFWFSFRKKLNSYRSRLIMTIVFMLLSSFAITGCVQPPVSFAVVATSGNISHTIPLSLQQ